MANKNQLRPRANSKRKENTEQKKIQKKRKNKRYDVYISPFKNMIKSVIIP